MPRSALFELWFSCRINGLKNWTGIATGTSGTEVFLGRGVYRVPGSARETAVKSLIATPTFAAAAALIVLSLSAPAQAAAWREYPWCAVIDYGDGGVSWECNYRTIEECYPNVLAGNKGTCTQNPAGGGPQASAPAVSHKPHKRHVQQ